MSDWNKCDKCGVREISAELIWVGSEDFEPRSNEVVPPHLCTKYAALCEDCYMVEINPTNLSAIADLIEQAQETFPHFESARGQLVIKAAIHALDQLKELKNLRGIK